MFTGNADRIIHFQLPKLNAENIMFTESHSVVFIDQAFTFRKDRLKPLLELLKKSVNAQSGSKDCIYDKYIEPLVKNSFDRNKQNELSKNPLRNPSDKEMDPTILLENFNELIKKDGEFKLKINEKISFGIHEAVKLLVDNKESVLNLANTHVKRNDIESNYAELENTLINFGVKNHDENI